MNAIAPKYTEFNGTHYEAGTDERVISILDNLRRDGQNTRIRIHLGDPETGMSWLEEHGTMGYVGRRGGEVKTPILIYNKRAQGGRVICTRNVLKITDTKGKPFYQHPKYFVPELFIFDLREVETVTDGLPWRVTTPDDVIAHCATEAEAERLVGFFKGTRFSK